MMHVHNSQVSTQHVIKICPDQISFHRAPCSFFASIFAVQNLTRQQCIKYAQTVHVHCLIPKGKFQLLVSETKFIAYKA